MRKSGGSTPAKWWQSPLLWVPVAGVLLVLAALWWYPAPWAQPSFTLASSEAFFAPEEAGGVRVNYATVAELSALPGIGGKKAQAIVEYREQHGLFRQADDLLMVQGIGEKTLDALRDLIRFD